MVLESPQPNVLGSGSLTALPPIFWILVVATGAGAGIGGSLLMLLLRAVQKAAWPYRPGDDFLSAVQNAAPLRTVALLIAAGIIAGVAGFALRAGKGGGHGGELAATIWFNAGRLEPLPTLVRATVSIVIVAMGASLGREAAPKQFGALVASMLARWASIPHQQRRLLAACGAGAGIAAVYNVPFGGAIFALEVLLGTISLPLVPPALAASVVATAISWVFLGNSPTYDVPSYSVRLDEILWALVVGPLAGLVAVAYVRLISWADMLRPRGALLLVSPVVVFAGLGVLALAYPQVLGNGKDTVQLAFLGELPLPLLVALVAAKPLATSACLGCGAPGGLFTPTLTLGAVFGGTLGQAWLDLWPGAPPGVFAIIGACAVLAASTQGPVSAVVLVLELTRRLDTLMVPVMLATAGAVLVARLLEIRSIYSGRIHLGRSAALATGREDSKGFIALSSAARIAELLRAILRAESETKPVYVVDEQGSLAGEVSARRVRDDLPDNLLLETATAADFAANIDPILGSDDEAAAVSRTCRGPPAARPADGKKASRSGSRALTAQATGRDAERRRRA